MITLDVNNTKYHEVEYPDGRIVHRITIEIKDGILYISEPPANRLNFASEYESAIRNLLYLMFDAAPEMEVIGIPLQKLSELVGHPISYVRKTLQKDFKMRTINARYKYPLVTGGVVTGIMKSVNTTSHYQFHRKNFIE